MDVVCSLVVQSSLQGDHRTARELHLYTGDARSYANSCLNNINTNRSCLSITAGWLRGGGVPPSAPQPERLTATYPFMVFQLPRGWAWLKLLLSMQKFHFKYGTKETLPSSASVTNKTHDELIYSRGDVKELSCFVVSPKA